MDKHWGTGLRAELPHFYGKPDATPAEVDQMIEAMRATAHLFPKPFQSDIEAFIKPLDEAGILRGIVTSHLTPIAIEEMRTARLAGSDFTLDPDSFLFIQGSDVTPALKPDPAVFAEALPILEARGIGPESIFYVGDDLRDGLAAYAAGLAFIGVATGVTSVEEFRDNHFYAVPRLAQVPPIVLGGEVDLHALAA